MLEADSRLRPGEKLALHPQFSAYMHGERIYPIGIEISPSGICNASCNFCWYSTGELGDHRNVFLDTKRISEFLFEAHKLGVKAITWTGGGEPTLHKDFGEIVDLAHDLGLQQGMFTNALAMPKFDPAKMEWIRVTVTNKPLKRECIKPLRAAKTLGFAFNYVGSQDDEYLKHVLAVALGLEAAYVQVRPALKFHGETVDIQPPQFSHPLLHVTDYKFEDAKHKHEYKTCEGWRFVPFLWEDGDLSTCGYMRKHLGYVLGNIYRSSLKDILDASPHSVPVHENCQVACKLHEINKAIHSAREIEDVNFP